MAVSAWATKSSERMLLNGKLPSCRNCWRKNLACCRHRPGLEWRIRGLLAADGVVANYIYASEAFLPISFCAADLPTIYVPFGRPTEALSGIGPDRRSCRGSRSSPPQRRCPGQVGVGRIDSALTSHLLTVNRAAAE